MELYVCILFYFLNYEKFIHKISVILNKLVTFLPNPLWEAKGRKILLFHYPL